MTKASDNAYPSLLITEGTEPSAPAAGKQRVYIDSTSHHLMRTNSSGTETDIETAASNGLATDTLWDAAGDLVQGSGANTAAKLSAGLAGQVLRSAGAAAANTWAYPPGYEFSYDEKTTDTSITATTEGTANTIITGSAVSYDGSTAVFIDVFSAQVNPNGGNYLAFILTDGGTAIGQIGFYLTSAGIYSAFRGGKRITPSNASHTYGLKAFSQSGTATVYAGSGGSGANLPAFLRVTKV